MQRTLTTEKLPIRLWLPDIDADTLQQAKNLANLPCIFHHVAIMPDAHVGYGMPIGGVAAAVEVVIPNAVGVDIGCGVAACRTSLAGLDGASLKRLLGEVRRHIPLGFQHHKQPQPHSRMPEIDAGEGSGELAVVEAEYESGRLQLGTLGGGNHFIEVQGGDDGFLWLMIHSGSRNLGYRVANHYNRIAAQATGRHKLFPLSWQLDYLKGDSGEGRSYLREMEYCVRFAAANRRAMMDRVQELLADLQPGVEFTAFYDVAHNYAAVEEHFGRRVVVHRRGRRGRRRAISASSPAPRAATATWCAALAMPRASPPVPMGRGGGWGENRPSGNSTCARRSPASRSGAFSTPSATARISRRPPGPIRISTRSWPTSRIWCASSPPSTPWRWSRAEGRRR